MEQDEFLKRCRELYDRCEKTAVPVSTQFLTPAEQFKLRRLAKISGWDNLIFVGGSPENERKIAVFLPYYMEETDVEPSEFIKAVSAVTKFSNPGHRDYLGSLLGLGIKRECLGDIYVDGEKGWFYCLPSVLGHILMSLERIGRGGGKLAETAVSEIPIPERKVRKVTFTVKSQRIDAVAAGMFGISRSSMAELISAGALSLNYEECLRVDAAVNEGDVISVRGHGKGIFLGGEGVSRKGRTFSEAEIYQ